MQEKDILAIQLVVARHHLLASHGLGLPVPWAGSTLLRMCMRRVKRIPRHVRCHRRPRHRRRPRIARMSRRSRRRVFRCRALHAHAPHPRRDRQRRRLGCAVGVQVVIVATSRSIIIRSIPAVGQSSRVSQCISFFVFVVFVARLVGTWRVVIAVMARIVSAPVDTEASRRWSVASVGAVPYVFIKVSSGNNRVGVWVDISRSRAI